MIASFVWVERARQMLEIDDVRQVGLNEAQQREGAGRSGGPAAVQRALSGTTWMDTFWVVHQSGDAAYHQRGDPADLELGTDGRVVARVRTEMEKRRKVLAADGAVDDPIVRHDDQYASLHLALIARKREALLELRDEQRIDDIVLRQVQATLDVEEIRFSRADPVD